MTDPEIEDLLRRYRPVGPPAPLRERILETARDARIWPWAAAAAAVLISASTFHLAARSAVDGADLRPGPAADVRVADDLAAMLGGDARAREWAELILIEQELRAEASRATAIDADADLPGELP